MDNNYSATIPLEEYEQLKKISFQYEQLTGESSNTIMFKVKGRYHADNLTLYVYKGEDALREFKETIVDDFNNSIDELERIIKNKDEQLKALKEIKEIFNKTNTYNL